MDSTNTINSWKEKIKANLLKEHFYSFSTDESFTLPIINDDANNLFDLLLKGETFIFGELNDVTFIGKAMSDFINEHQGVNILFSNKNQIKQREILNKIIEINNNSIANNSYSIAYLSFGKITYQLDGKKFQAPLVFIPVRVFKSTKDNYYRVVRLNKEIKLNTPLIELLKKERKIDLSYPVNNKFNLGEYLYYLSVKVKPINWIVNNENFLSCFDFSYYSDLKFINENQNIIAQNQLVKRIAYLNSEFFSFNQKESFPLDTKFLSLLDMQNEEYNLLRTISRGDNLLIRCEQHSNKYHFITNVILTYLLNNKRVLLAYSNNEEKNELLNEIKKNSIEKFTLDLSLGSINKTDTLASLSSYDKLVLPYNSLHPIAIDEDVTKYYNLKNSFQEIINSLRTTKNSLNTSINKIINNYYALAKYPLLDVFFKATNKIDLEVLQQYLLLVKEFANSIEALNCPIEEHPFYGFNRKVMKKEDYIPLKNSVISLSATLQDAINIYNYGVKKYHLPSVSTLKEMKAVLNILTFVDYYKDLPIDFLKDDIIDETYDKLKNLYLKIEQNNQKLDSLLGNYALLKNISLEELEQANKSKKKKTAYASLKKKYQVKHLSTNEYGYLFDSILSLLRVKQNLEESKLSFNHSYIEFLSNHTFEELREIINNINNYRYNLNYLSDRSSFDICYLVKDTNIESSKHRQAMQLVFNSILSNSQIVQKYFDKNVFNYEKINLDAYLEKINMLSLNFASINDYIDYYVSKHKINKAMNMLGDKLLECGHYSNFENIFLKRFYYDLLTATLKNKKMSDSLSRKNIFSLLENFKDSDNKRKSLIEKIIYNNFSKNTSTTLYSIKATEGNEIKKLLSDENYFINLDSLCDLFSQSIHNFKPCVLTSYKNVSSLLNNKNYQFDVVILLSNRSMKIRDVLPCLVKSNQLLVIDQKPLTEDIRSSLITSSNPANLVFASKNTFNEIVYTQRDHSLASLIQNNLYDLDFKAYLVEKLNDYGFDVGMNRALNDQVIDILVKVPNSNSSIAIMVDHFPYYSPEEASEAFYYQEQFLKDKGYSPYRVFTALFFIDEENEFNKLIEFIIAQSKLIPEAAVKKNTILLMDYLFPLFKDPRHVYYELTNVNKLNEKLTSFLEECAPISLDEIRVVFKENIEEELNNLAASGSIEIKDNFILLIGKKIRFRRVDRNKEFYRPLDLVSDIEYYDAIYDIINYKSSLDKDTIIKMILLSLGYKKANKEKYEFVEERIDYLLEQKVIFIENNIIYKNI